jgi:hypothetical protein
VPAKHLEVVEPVEQRHHDHPVGRGRAFERAHKLSCLGRNPEHVHGPIEPSGGGHRGVKVAEERALDAHNTVVAGERFLAHKEQNVPPNARERGAEEGTDPACSEDGVPHSATLTAARSGCASRITHSGYATACREGYLRPGSLAGASVSY